MIIKNIVASFFLVFTLFPASGQNIDSLKALLVGKTGSSRADVLFDISFNILKADKRLALKYAVEGYHLSLKLNDSLRAVRTGLVVASAFRRLQKIDSSLQIYHAIVKVAEKKSYNEELAIALNSMGIACTLIAEYDKALECYQKGFELRKNSNDTAGQINVLINIGVVHYKLKNYQKALDIFLEAQALQRRSGYQDDEALLLLNIGHCHAYLANYDQALDYVDKAMKFDSQDYFRNRLMAAHFVKGVVYFGLQKLDKAETHFLQSYKDAKLLEDIRFQLDNIEYLAQLFIRQERIPAAILSLEEADKLITKYPGFNLEKIKIYLRFSDLYVQMKNWKMASLYLLRYTQLKDSVYTTEMTSNLMRLEAEYLERENQAKILAQNQLLAVKEEVISSQKMLNSVVAVLALVSIGFAGLLLRNFQHKKRLNALLDKKINERTRELQESHNKLEKAFEERDQVIHRTSQRIADVTIRIKSLCAIGMKEFSDPATLTWIEKIEATLGQFRVCMGVNFYKT